MAPLKSQTLLKPTNLDSLKRLRSLTHLLDNAFRIPGTGFRVGLDPILGLIPGVGDLVGTALSVYIVLEAARFGVPSKILLQMLSNIALETTFGSIPIVGDWFDATWKANLRNLALLEAHLEPLHTNHLDDR